MNEKTIIKMVGFVILVPIAVGIAGSIISGCVNAGSKIKYNMKIKKGLKNGTIIEKDGQYYEVTFKED